MPRFAVSFVGGLADQATEALAWIGAKSRVRAKSAVRVQSSVVELDAADADAAVAMVREALEPHGTFSGFQGRQLPRAYPPVLRRAARRRHRPSSPSKWSLDARLGA